MQGELIVEQIKESVQRNDDAFENSGKCSKCDTNRCKGHEKYLTYKIRNFVSKKTYPVTTNPFDEGDREATDKARLATLALQTRLLEKVIKPSGIRVEDLYLAWK